MSISTWRFRLAVRLGLCAGVFMALPMGLTVAAQEATAPTPEERLNIEAQALAARSAWYSDPLELQLLEIAIRELEEGYSHESVLARTQQRRANVLEDRANSRARHQEICDNIANFAAGGASAVCMMGGIIHSLNPALASIAAIICGTVAQPISRSICYDAEWDYGIQTRSPSQLLQAAKEFRVGPLQGNQGGAAGPDLWRDGGFQENINIRLDDTVDDVLRKHGEIARILEDKGIDLKIKEALDDNSRTMQREMEEKSREILEEMREIGRQFRRQDVSLPPDVAEA